MKRQMIEIDREKCNGCGLCVNACHEGAIGLVDGKAELLRDDFCDGLGNCLPVCPTGAITFVEREAEAYDAQAVADAQRAKANAAPRAPEKLACGCPGTQARALSGASSRPAGIASGAPSGAAPSHLNQWPVQLKLVPVNAPYFAGAHLLVAADCSAYAMGNFHDAFMRGRVTLIGCPKLDEGDYREKLTAILRNNDIRSVTVTRMEVPCCSGIVRAVVEAMADSGKNIPLTTVILGVQGEVLSQM